jgi:hypothetical protein
MTDEQGRISKQAIEALSWHFLERLGVNNHEKHKPESSPRWDLN